MGHIEKSATSGARNNRTSAAAGVFDVLLAQIDVHCRLGAFIAAINRRRLVTQHIGLDDFLRSIAVLFIHEA